jgi:hypothetical protein
MYQFRLRGLKIDRPNQGVGSDIMYFWCPDIGNLFASAPEAFPP